MPAAKPAQRVAELVDVAGVPENVVAPQAHISGDVDVRHLRNHDTGIVRPEIGELPALDRRGRRVVALHANPELVQQRRPECLGILQRPVRHAEMLQAGHVAVDVACLELEIGDVPEIAEAEIVARADIVIEAPEYLIAVRGPGNQADVAAGGGVGQRHEGIAELDGDTIEA